MTASSCSREPAWMFSNGCCRLAGEPRAYSKSLNVPWSCPKTPRRSATRKTSHLCELCRLNEQVLVLHPDLRHRGAFVVRCVLQGLKLLNVLSGVACVQQRTAAQAGQTMIVARFPRLALHHVTCNV